MYVLYIILNPQVVCVFRERYIRNMPVFSLPLFYAFIYAVLHLSFFEKNSKTCVCVCVSVLQAVEKINAAIKKGVAEETVNELMNPDAQLPQVYPSAADLYQRELTSLQQQSAEVKTLTSTQFQLTLSLWLFCYFFLSCNSDFFSRNCKF